MPDFTSVIDDLPPLREVIARFDLAPKKSLGQNFLLDLNITDKIVRCAFDRYDGDWSKVHAIEIGPGPGGLTRSLLKSQVKHVSAIEFDPRAVQAQSLLTDKLPGHLDVVQCDALECDLLTLGTAPRIIVANLPYNIATPLLVNWLRQLRHDQGAYDSMTLMFQKEVAERICARPGAKSYGRLAVLAQWICDVEIVYHLPPSAFTPPPKVDSAVVHFAPKMLRGDAPYFEDVERVTAQAFGQRRKMIRSSLKNYADRLESLGLEGTRRAETLSISEFLALAKSQI